jgi:hypothetical protein
MSDAILTVEVIIIIPTIAVLATLWRIVATRFPSTFESELMPDLLTLALAAGFWFWLEIALSRSPFEGLRVQVDKGEAIPLPSHRRLLSKWVGGAGGVVAACVMCVIAL